MASIIRIKRSPTSGNPTTLGAGELAYSALAGTQANGGDRLYIGFGTETAGDAAQHYVIGGKYFTDLLDHVHGTLTASSALIVDSSSKLDNLKVDNLDLNGNTISTTDTNGNLILAPNGTGRVSLTSSNAASSTSTGALVVTGGVGIGGALYVGGLIQAASASFSSINSTPIGNTTASTGAFTTLSASSTSTFTGAATFNGGINIGADTLAEYIYDTVGGAVTGGTGITVTNSDVGNTSTVNITNTGVTGFGSAVGSSTAIPVITFNAQGQLTAVTTASISTTLSVAGDSGTDSIALATDTLTVAGGEGIDTSVNSATNTITIAAEDASTSNKGVASFADADFNVTSGAVELKDTVVKTVSTDSGALTPSTHGFSILGGEGIDVTHSGTTITVAGEDASTSNKGVASFDTNNFTVTSGAVTTKTITLGSSTLTVGSTTTSIAGVTELTVDNLNFNGNTITSTDTNGNIIISPNGTGKVDVSGSIITGLNEPVDPTDAATKAYVDTVAQGLHVHEAATVATTGTLATLSGGSVTYANGTAGVGATLTLSAGLTALDGVTLTNGMRILVKNEAAQANNGLYVRTSATVLTRSTDFDTAAEIGGGDFTFVEQGTTLGRTGWVQVTEVTTVGTDNIVWDQFAGQNLYIAGNGLTLTGNQFDVVGTADRITANANSIDIASTYVGQSTITTLGTIGTGTWQGGVVSSTYGGTGVNNGGRTITIAGNVTHAGSFARTFTATGTTTLTLPTTGTLATLDGAETFTNKTLTSPSISGGTINNASIGATTRSTGAFTTLTSNGATTFTAGTASSSSTTGTLVVTGGVGVSGNIYGAGAATSTLDGFNIDGGTY